MNRKEIRKILEEERENKRTVYLLEIEICGKTYFKIGSTTNITTRINSLIKELKKQVNDDFDIKLILQFNFKNASKKEAELKDTCSCYNVKTGYKFGGDTEIFKHSINIVHTFLEHIEKSL